MKMTLNQGNFQSIDNVPYCKAHYLETYRSKGKEFIVKDGDFKGKKVDLFKFMTTFVR